MRDSSVKTISFHSAAHVLLSSHQWRWRCLWFCVTGRPNNGLLADRPLYCKRCRMVCVDTESYVTDSISMCCATVHDVTVRSTTAMRTICLSSREVVH
ncbi:hypothetical protein TNCV_765941 [Trichonephila clavipes]|nr:hypothetical protein TNCV_765941 [Trichonephila clavipes]